jgi:hypothetical protein
MLSLLLLFCFFLVLFEPSMLSPSSLYSIIAGMQEGANGTSLLSIDAVKKPDVDLISVRGLAIDLYLIGN